MREKLQKVIQDMQRFDNMGWGKTHHAAETMKKVDGTVICFSNREARRVNSQYGVKSISIEDVERGKLLGLRTPSYYDQTTVLELLRESFNEITRLGLENHEKAMEIYELRRGNK